ncbi:sulfonate transport system ATP-binding protein [Thermoflexales bacterium]|nr:sulfonate transport system ATP-binding protein [Thermoflexales bacterium]
MDAPAAIRLSNVTKVYRQGVNEVRALDSLSLTLPAQHFVAVMGASGSGKSTLLHIAAGLARVTSGEVVVHDQTLSAMADDDLTRFRRKHIGLIFQSFNLLPTLNAIENVALPLIINGAKLNVARAKAKNLLALVGLSDRLAHRPDELSGGQQQRVAIARALINEAPLLLADEPTGNLDSHTGEDLLQRLRALATEQHRTIIMVTHDQRAASYADQVIRLQDGKIVTSAE